ncbi:hypothetical protein H6F89_34655 [Cyanobacteria bacterium FACHB-63]|nr:hypothetical protein [Cyanobacteria bacterium FACHB-63]
MARNYLSKSMSLRLTTQQIQFLKTEAKRRGIGYTQMLRVIIDSFSQQSPPSGA